MWLAGRITKSLEFEEVTIRNIPEKIDPIPLSWAEGMIGAIPCFETREQAEAYANGAQVFEVTYPEDK